MTSVKYISVKVTFYNKDQTRYLIKMLNQLFGHGRQNWTIRNRILAKVNHGKVLNDIPVLISSHHDTAKIEKFLSVITYASLEY